MRLGYNTNGFPHHEVEEVARILAELRYDAIAITPDVFHLDPFHGGVERASALRPLLVDLGLAVAVETGARFLLDRRVKHQPTLLSPLAGANRRLEGLRRSLEVAVALGAETISFWSGSWVATADEPVPPDDDALLERLCRGAGALLDEAQGSGVVVCFEPEPGMAIDSLARLDAFLERLDRPELRVMLDVGHVPVTEEITAAEAVTLLAPRLGGLQLDDSAGGVHEHLMPGDGEIDFTAVVAAARQADFDGLACLELPRHGHDPVTAARVARLRMEAAGL